MNTKIMIMKKKISFIGILLIAVSFSSSAQYSSDDPFKSSKDKYEEFKRKTEGHYNDFIKRANEKYSDFMRRSWERYASISGIPVPEDNVKPIDPIVLPIDKDVPIKDRNLAIENIPVVTTPEPEPQPIPIEPIKEKPLPALKYHDFVWSGTSMEVREVPPFKIKGTNEDAVADVWMQLSDNYNNLIIDCLELRDKYHLCDWAYLSVLNALSESLMGKDTNEAVLLMAFLYCQSGYSMRLAFDNQKLVMLYSSKHKIFNINYFVVGDETFYPYNSSAESLRIFNAAFPNEKYMSLWINTLPSLVGNNTKQRNISSKRYEDMSANVCVNKNVIDFFDTYPTSEVNSNLMSRWAMYANTPLCKEARSTLYDTLKKHISGKSQLMAANMLLNWVQTGFEYEYDDVVWGHDRAFFGDETLYYPYCDCEDRSILFSHLIRDLLGLDVALVYYPGHLASAVAFTDNVTGDYILINNRKFVVCDPTYINAPVGMTMPDMDNSSAKVILLRKN